MITAKAKGERSPTVSFSHSRFHIASGIWRLPPDLHLKATAAVTTSGVVGNANPISGGCRAFQSIQSDRMPLHGTSNRKHPSVVSTFRPVARSVGIHISKSLKQIAQISFSPSRARSAMVAITSVVQLRANHWLNAVGGCNKSEGRLKCAC